MCLATSYRGSGRMEDGMFKAPASYLDTLKARFQLWHWKTSGKCFFLLKHIAITESGRIVGSPLPKSREDQVMFVKMCKASSHVQKSASNEKKLHSAIARSDRLQPRPKHVTCQYCCPCLYHLIFTTCDLRAKARWWDVTHTILLYFPGRTGKPIGMADTVLACT